MPYAKSIANRLLIMQALSAYQLTFTPHSTATDSVVLKQCIEQSSETYFCGEGGTTLRFLLAYLSLQPGRKFITGSSRLSERPISPLVNALIQCGVKVAFTGEEGKLPIELVGMADTQKPMYVSIPGNISSQFISAMLLIAPYFNGGGTIEISGLLISAPYVEMTISLMKKAGVKVEWEKNKITVGQGSYRGNFQTERDWSAASYAYSLCALNPCSSIFLPGLHLDSLQGDRICAKLTENFGVSSVQTEEGVQLQQNGNPVKNWSYNFTDCPDLAQTFAIMAIGLMVQCRFTGLKTLRIKETDRIAGLADLINKLGGNAAFGEDYLFLNRTSNLSNSHLLPVFNDHRMAMSLAPLAQIISPLHIEDAAVVNKSFPQFWQQLRKLGFSFEQITSV